MHGIKERACQICENKIWQSTRGEQGSTAQAGRRAVHKTAKPDREQGWLAGWLASWLASCLARWLAGWLATGRPQEAGWQPTGCAGPTTGYCQAGS